MCDVLRDIFRRVKLQASSFKDQATMSGSLHCGMQHLLVPLSLESLRRWGLDQCAECAHDRLDSPRAPKPCDWFLRELSMSAPGLIDPSSTTVSMGTIWISPASSKNSTLVLALHLNIFMTAVDSCLRSVLRLMCGYEGWGGGGARGEGGEVWGT